jgi:coenzyme F420-reducing hydrogenase gamma subunit
MNSEFASDSGELLCPACRDTYLHHDKIEIFERKEDATQGLHVTTTGKNVKVDTSMEGCPSSRRDGITIRFWCENCHEISMLTLVQHKGQTFFNFVPTGEKVKDEAE